MRSSGLPVRHTQLVGRDGYDRSFPVIHSACQVDLIQRVSR